MRHSATSDAPNAWWNSPTSWVSIPLPPFLKPVGMVACSKPRIASLIMTPSTRKTCCKVLSSRPPGGLTTPLWSWPGKRRPTSTGPGTRPPKGWCLWATVAAQPVVEHLRLQVPRRRPQATRDTTLALRFCPVTLCPPRHRQREGLPTVTLWAVQVQEVEPPTDVTPIEWLLLTTVAVETVDDAI